MATYTQNLNLKKPSTGERYDVIGDLNDAKDKIDTHAGAVNAQLAQSRNNNKPSWSVWEEFEQRGINIKWLGAKGDGVTDDTQAIKNALLLAKTIGGAYVFGDYSPQGYFVSSTLYIPSNTTLDFNKSKVIPKAISLGGTYDVASVIIVGNPELEGNADNPVLINTHIIYADKNIDFPSRPITIRRANDGIVRHCKVVSPYDTCFIASRGAERPLFEYNHAEDPRFHGFGTDDGANRAIFQYNYCKDILGEIEGDGYCFDTSAENANDHPCIVRFNYAVNGLRFFKGMVQATLVHDNYMENFPSQLRQVIVVGYGKGIHVYNNTMVDCACPFLIGSGGFGPARESTITGNRIFNRTVPIRELISFAQDVVHVKFENNYIVHDADITVNAPFVDFNRPLSDKFSFSHNQIYINGTTVNNNCIQVSEMNNMTFKDNTIRTTHDVGLFWIAGENNIIDNNDIEIKPASGSNSIRIISGNNTVRNNKLRGGKFRLDGYLTCDYSGNDADSWYDPNQKNGLPQTYAGNPNTFITPRFIGDECLDTTNNKFYKAKGTLNTDWLLLN